MHLIALAPILVLGALIAMNRMGPNPIQTLEHRTGDIALVLLILCLSCTPLRLITKRSVVMAFRRPLGLYSFLYAAIHVLIFFILDYGLDMTEAFQAILLNQYLWSGAFAFILLLLLAVTSNNRSKVILKKNWKRLHSLVYAAAFLVILHFGMSMKGNLFLLRGEITFPLVALGIWALLMILRIKFVRKRLMHSQ